MTVDFETSAAMVLFVASISSFLAIKIKLKLWSMGSEDFRSLLVSNWNEATIRPPLKVYVRGFEEFTENQRGAIAKRDRFVCQYCLARCRRRPRNFFAKVMSWVFAFELWFNEYDHVLSKYNGGETTVANGVCSHRGCNRRKGKGINGAYAPIVIGLVAERQPEVTIFDGCVSI